MDFVPLYTTEYKHAFCKALDSHCGLPNDVKQLVWKHMQRDQVPVCPGAPKKLRPLTARLLRLGKGELAKKRLY